MQQEKISLSKVLLQEEAVKQLSAFCASGKIAQTCLFVGADSCGRMPAALAYSALLQCESPVKSQHGLLDSCSECSSCQRIATDSHPDVKIVKPQGYEIRIDQVRAMQEAAMLKPSMSDRHIFIIDPAEKLNLFSANSLLKIFEEAPEYAVFILLAQNTDSVLPTILSRSRVVRFKSHSFDQVRKELIKTCGINSMAAATCCSLAEGRFGQALQIFRANGHEKKNVSYSFGESQSSYIIELERQAEVFCLSLNRAKSIDQALYNLIQLESDAECALLASRKNFCIDLVMSLKKPAAFSLLFSDLIIERLSKCEKIIKKSYESYIKDAKKGYSSAMIKEIEAQIANGLNGWKNRQISAFIACLANFYADVQRWAVCQDETLLLNIDRKEDIITVAEVEGAKLAGAKIAMLKQSLLYLRRHVQPLLLLENIITQIGGPEA